MPVAIAGLEAFLEAFIDAMVTEGKLELREFGVFRVHERKPMIGRNPRTGAAVPLPKRRFVSFRMGRTMRERLGTGSTGTPIASRRARKRQDPAP